MRLDIGIISHTCRKWQALLLEEVLDLGSLVVGASVNHIVADKFLLAVACKGTVSHAKQFAQVVVTISWMNILWAVSLFICNIV